jgi:hypothetical protein
MGQSLRLQRTMQSPPTCSTTSAPRKEGERLTPRPARRPAQPPATKAHRRDRCAERAAICRDDDLDPYIDGLDPYIKEMIDSRPPLTSEQRNRLALILCTGRRA